MLHVHATGPSIFFRSFKNDKELWDKPSIISYSNLNTLWNQKYGENVEFLGYDPSARNSHLNINKTNLFI